MEEKNTGIQVDPKYKLNLEKLNSLKSELSKLISDRDILENTVKKNLEALYVAKIGKNEYELFNFECQVAKLRRKIDLIQVKINHGEKVNLFTVEKQLDDEYKNWQEKMNKMLSDIKASETRLKSLMSEKESKELQSLYRFLVKKLHPDVNANQMESEILLWDRTQIAYKIGDLEELNTIKLLIEDTEITNIKKDSLSVIDKQIKTVKEKIFTSMQYIKKLKSEFPFTIESNINDESWVKEKNYNALKKIENIKIQIKQLQLIIENILLNNIDKANQETIN